MGYTSKKRSWTKRSYFLTVAGAIALSSTLLLSGCEEREEKIAPEATTDVQVQEKPNIIYIVLDDTGFSDFGSFGSEIATPAIDALAEDGLQYNNFHVSPVCSPTRASLLTGRNNHAVGMGNVANFDFGEEHPSGRGEIPKEAGFVTEVLAEEGYTNFGLGKWHITPTVELSPAGPFDRWPLGRGFDRYYGNLEDSSDQFRPELFRDNSFVTLTDFEDYHYSEDIIDNAEQYVTDHMSLRPDDPFFMYIGFGAQHMPHQVPETYIERYEGQYDAGWDVIREQRFNKQKELGIIPSDATLAPREEAVPAWDSLTDEQKDVYTRFMETYAGFLTHTDEQIAELVDTLEALDALDDTIIIVTSDNGASFSGGTHGAVNQALAYNKIPANLEQLEDKIADIGGEATNSDYPAGWAQVSNTPFAKFKGTTHAGGIRTPLIVHWPAEIEADDTVRSQFVHVSDITATMYDILNITPPDVLGGVEQLPLNGVSFAATFTDADAPAAKKTQYFEHSGKRTIYHDGWKAISVHVAGTPFEDDVWELYNVEEDFSELNNVADQYPEKVEELVAIWQEEAEANNVLPLSEKFLEGLKSLPSDNIRAKETFTFYPNMSHISESVAPMTLDRNHSIAIEASYEEGDEGVLLALGNDKSGYTFYIENGQLHYEYNNGNKRFSITSSEKLTTGALSIAYTFEQKEPTVGQASIAINGVAIGEMMIETLPLKTSFEGLDIGEDLLYPVSPQYANKGSYPYTGEMAHVTYTFEEANVELP